MTKDEKLNKAMDKLQDISDICIDYDGYRTPNELKYLVEDIKYYADKSIKEINGD